MNKRVGKIAQICISTGIALSLNCDLALAQNINAQRDQLRDLEREVELLSSKIEGNQKIAATQKKQLLELEKNIRSSIANVRSVEKDIKAIEGSMSRDGKQLVVLKDDLAEAKDNLRSLLRAGYMSTVRGSSTLSMLSIESQWNLELLGHQIEEITSKIAQKMDSLDATSSRLGVRYAQAEEKYEKLEILQKERSEELKKLTTEKKKMDAIVTDLNLEIKELSQQHKEKIAEIQRLERAIAQAMAKEREGSSGGEKMEIDYALSGSFASNKGRLPVPVSGGTIVGKHGLRNMGAGLSVTSRGIDVKCGAGVSVRVIFEGVVRGVFAVSGMGESVLVRHGEYLTVYTHLSEVSVKTGDKISGGTKIGTVDSDGVLHFELWKQEQDLNPEAWVKF